MALTKIDDRGVTYPLDLLDNEKIRFGTGNDLEVFHDGTNSYIHNTTGALRVTGSPFQIKNTADNEIGLEFTENGSVDLYYDGSKKAETQSWGVAISGELTTTNHVNIPNDTGKFMVGASNDLQLYHNGSDSYIDETGSGDLKIRSTSGIQLQNGSEKYLACHPDGAVELYYDDAIKTKTTSTGIQVFGNYVCSDNHKLLLGNNEDLQIYHDGTNNQIMSANGPIHLYSGVAIELRKGYDGSYETMLKAVPDGAVELYYNNSKKFETLSAGGQLIGQWGIGTSTTANAKLFVNPNVDGSTQRGITISGRKDVYNVMAINFVHATTNSSAGSVTFSSTSAVAFNTSSDYRLKENVVTLTDSITKLKQLNPVHFKWKDQPSVETDGFLAHEVQSIVPSAITGEKDALNENGNIEPQQIDISKLTPLLTAALQEAITKIETLETKVAALESS